MSQAGDCKLYMGRLVGEMGSGIDFITIESSEFGGSISGNNSDVNSCFGGVIGRISHNKDEDRTWDFSSVTLQGTVGNTTSKAAQRIGGLIAEIDGSYNGNSNHRTLNLIDVTVNGLTVSGPVSADGSMGGLLGYDWNKVDVNANSITVQDNSTDSTKSTVNIGSAAGHTAGLVYRATGHWKVTSIDIKNIKMTASGASSVGMLVNKGYTYSGNNVNFYTAGNSSAIYLELPASYTYNLALDSSSSINSSAVFDELCAYTCPSSSDIMKNGNGVISINTTFYTDGTNASGTYHAQTSYGAKPNPNSRYYYNLDAMDSVGTPSDTSDPAKLMIPQIQTPIIFLREFHMDTKRIKTDQLLYRAYQLESGMGACGNIC
ncbi:hypothetical protein SAMN02910317_02078 [Ruminococcaceae bacterium FB2012]|nr:hypothetical protein SAMN02910317_02078 [Ruminococcaceae bacterium FB2012]